jgi:hypothetical protein
MKGAVKGASARLLVWTMKDGMRLLDLLEPLIRLAKFAQLFRVPDV